jgi:hypothetical protein
MIIFIWDEPLLFSGHHILHFPELDCRQHFINTVKTLD